MCNISAARYPDGTLTIKAGIRSTFPQQVFVFLREPRGRAVDLEFLEQFGDSDYFGGGVVSHAGLEYAVRVESPDGSYWITPKGEEQGHEPHNWFRGDEAPLCSGNAPDLRAAHQVHTDGQAADFETPAWVHDAVFYQIFPDRFARGESSGPGPDTPWGSAPGITGFQGGNLQGIIDKLDYLADLGVNALYLNPVFEGQSNHRYDTTDYFKVDPRLGDLKVLRRLVDAVHERGMRVILDGVFNHCGNGHPFFQDVLEKGYSSRYWGWFHAHQWPIPRSFNAAGEACAWYECWWGHHTLPKFNYSNPEVRQYFLKVGAYWLEAADIDGWRLDVPNEVLQDFWPAFRKVVKDANPEAYITGELWDGAASYLRGDQFDGVMNYPLRRLLQGFALAGTVSAHALEAGLHELLHAYPPSAVRAMLNIVGSHDTRRAATLAAGVNGDRRFLLDALKLLASLQFALPGAPCIFYGDEIALEGGKDPDCRRAFPWGWEQDPNQRWRRELFDHYRRLIGARKNCPALRGGGFRTLEVDSDRELLAFERSAEDSRCVVAVNRSGRHQVVSLPTGSAVELLRGRAVHDDLVVARARYASFFDVSAASAAGKAGEEHAAPPRVVPLPERRAA